MALACYRGSARVNDVGGLITVGTLEIFLIFNSKCFCFWAEAFCRRPEMSRSPSTVVSQYVSNSVGSAREGCD